MARPDLLPRRLDTLYVAYFAIHLVASVLIDAQLSFPPLSQRIYPDAIQQGLQFYLDTFKDPFLQALANQEKSHVWFRTLVLSEVFLQVPVFVVGIVGLVRDDKRVYPLLVAYGTLAASSTMQCICSLLYGVDGVGLSKGQIFGLLQNYVPFCILPALLCIDMVSRIIGFLPSPSSVSVERKGQ